MPVRFRPPVDPAPPAPRQFIPPGHRVDRDPPPDERLTEARPRPLGSGPADPRHRPARPATPSTSRKRRIEPQVIVAALVLIALALAVVIGLLTL